MCPKCFVLQHSVKKQEIETPCMQVLDKHELSRVLKTKAHWCVSCPLVLVHVLVHFHFNLVSLFLALFQIGQLRWCEMMIGLELSFQNRTGRRSDKSARGHETAPWWCGDWKHQIILQLSSNLNRSQCTTQQLELLVFQKPDFLALK